VSELTRTTSGHYRVSLRRSVILAPLAVVLVVALLMSVGRRAEASARLNTCSLSTLRFTLQPDGGLGHGAYRVLVRNVGSSACTLTGYPRVLVPLDDRRDQSVQRSLQRVVPPGSFAKVSNTLNSYAGGYDGPTPSSGRVALPVTQLAPRTGAASFTMVWTEIGPKACPVSVTLELGIAGTSRLWETTQFAFVCSGVDVTPFARGSSGTWH